MANWEDAKVTVLETLQRPPSADLLENPIDYIFSDHFRQRMLCTVLLNLAQQGELDADLINAALKFLTTDFGLHIRDEERGLFPLLRKRAQSEDEVNQVLDQLIKEHSADRQDAEKIREVLDNLLTDDSFGLSEDERLMLIRFADNENNHLSLENAIVLPLARKRLTSADLRELAQKMAARRNVDISGARPR